VWPTFLTNRCGYDFEVYRDFAAGYRGSVDQCDYATDLVFRYVLEGMGGFTDCFRRRLESAKENGESCRPISIEVVAQALIAYLQGLYQVIRVLQDRTQVERQVLLRGLRL
jgi:hypothetical protein